MALNNQYLILNPKLKRIGTLTVNGATKFSNDSVKIQLADADTTSTSYDDDANAGTQDNFNGTINLNAQSKKFDHQGSLDVLQGQPDSDKSWLATTSLIMMPCRDTGMLCTFTVLRRAIPLLLNTLQRLTLLICAYTR